jgi:hypothetical protein
VAHACNPSYSGGKNQDFGLKPVRANSLREPLLENLHKKRAGGVAQGVGPEVKPQYRKKKKKRRKPKYDSNLEIKENTRKNTLTYILCILLT